MINEERFLFNIDSLLSNNKSFGFIIIQRSISSIHSRNELNNSIGVDVNELKL